MAPMSHKGLPTVLLVQLPIPPLGPGRIRGNVPLAAAYLKLFAERRGLSRWYAMEVFSAARANTLGDLALVEAILERDPWLVGFTCYVWNIERTLWIVRELKRRRPDIRIVLGGPEITADNAWVLDKTDYLVLGDAAEFDANAAAGVAASTSEVTQKEKINNLRTQMQENAKRKGVQIIKARQFLALIGFHLPRSVRELDAGGSTYGGSSALPRDVYQQRQDADAANQARKKPPAKPAKPAKKNMDEDDDK